MKFLLTAEVMQANYSKFMESIDKLFPARAEKLKMMYEAIGEERLMYAPASASEHFHNCFPGGYIDHVLRVMAFANKEYKHYEDLGFDLSGFTRTELLFAALNHDLGKLGFIGDGKEGYVDNPSDWHKKNMGKWYEINDKIPFTLTPDRSLFLLQSFQIPVTWNEYVAIRIHDGIYDDANKAYFISYKPSSKLRNVMPQILHNADIAAARFEFERWNKVSKMMNTERLEDIDLSNFEDKKPSISKQAKQQTSKANLHSAFDSVFGKGQ